MNQQTLTLAQLVQLVIKRVEMLESDRGKLNKIVQGIIDLDNRIDELEEMVGNIGEIVIEDQEFANVSHEQKSEAVEGQAHAEGA